MSSKLMLDLYRYPLDFLEFCCDSVVSPRGQGVSARRGLSLS